MKFEVRFTKEAEQCVRDIRDWIAERSAEGALRWITALETACSNLKERAADFALAPEADQFKEPVRQVLFKTQRGNIYRALFVVRAEIVHGVSVRGPGQAPIDPVEVAIPE